LFQSDKSQPRWRLWFREFGDKPNVKFDTLEFATAVFDPRVASQKSTPWWRWRWQQFADDRFWLFFDDWKSSGGAATFAYDNGRDPTKHTVPERHQYHDK